MSNPKVKNWIWILILQFFIISIIEIKFAIFGFLFLIVPVVYSIKNKQEVYCMNYCPKRSLLQKILPKISFGKTLPRWINTEEFKLSLLVFITCAFLLSLYFSGFTFIGLCLSILKLLFSCLIIAIILGVINKPLAWCKICPAMYIGEQIKKLP